MKERTKRGLCVAGEICGKGSKYGVIATGILFVVGGICNLIVDCAERNERKSKKH